VSGNLDKPERASHASEAYAEVLRRLRSGVIGPADKIVDAALAAELNMSRMPAREGLLRLVNEGYLIGSTRGFMLPRLSSRDIAEIFEIRKLLEPRAAASATINLTEVDLEGLRAAYEDACSAEVRGSREGLMRAHTQFREIWLQVVPNRRMAATVSRFFDHVHAIRGATLHDPATRSLSVRILGRILDGFERRDALYVHDQIGDFIEQARVSFIALRETGEGIEAEEEEGKDDQDGGWQAA
jgi:DNA-binding GntR family transcriptional regulator